MNMIYVSDLFSKKRWFLDYCRYYGRYNKGMIEKMLIILVLLPLSLQAQKGVTLGNMNMTYQIVGDEIQIQLKAPTTGWLGIGFNSTNSIVKSDLYLPRVRNGSLEGIDMYVAGAGNPKNDTLLGGSNNLKLINGIEDNNSTELTFRLPLPSNDKYDYTHSLSREFWLILAYSQSDDYNHHSTMRKHVPFKFLN